MSRVTPPVTIFNHVIRRISSSAQAARPSSFLDASSRYLPRSIHDLKTECGKRHLKIGGSKSELVDRLVAYDLTRAHSTTSGHRPSPTHPLPIARPRPLMQGFRTSAPAQTAHDTSTIDFFFFPEVPEPPSDNPFQGLRVPLLPDNYYPNRSPSSGHAIESLDEAVPRPEIMIVASHPEDVVPSAMTEVVGNDGLEKGIEELTKSFKSVVGEEAKEPGMLRELFAGMLDDLFGSKKPKPAM